MARLKQFRKCLPNTIKQYHVTSLLPYHTCFFGFRVVWKETSNMKGVKTYKNPLIDKTYTQKIFFKSSKYVECSVSTGVSVMSSSSSLVSSTSIAPRLGSRTTTRTSKTAITPSTGVTLK